MGNKVCLNESRLYDGCALHTDVIGYGGNNNNVNPIWQTVAQQTAPEHNFESIDVEKTSPLS